MSAAAILPIGPRRRHPGVRALMAAVALAALGLAAVEVRRDAAGAWVGLGPYRVGVMPMPGFGPGVVGLGDPRDGYRTREWAIRGGRTLVFFGHRREGRRP